MHPVLIGLGEWYFEKQVEQFCGEPYHSVGFMKSVDRCIQTMVTKKGLSRNEVFKVIYYSMMLLRC